MEEKPNYYAIIPADVRYDRRLKDKEKLLYGEITALSHKEGYCYSTNSYFAKLYGISKKNISIYINDLIKYGYLESRIIYKDNSKEILERRLYLKGTTPILDFRDTPIPKKKDTPIPKNREDNNININNTRNNNIIVEHVIHYMNELAGTNFKSNTGKTISLITARLREGFNQDELEDVVWYKYNEWFKNPVKFKNGVSSDKYFRPNTIFSNNFEEYLEQYKLDCKKDSSVNS